MKTIIIAVCVLGFSTRQEARENIVKLAAKLPEQAAADELVKMGEGARTILIALRHDPKAPELRADATERLNWVIDRIVENRIGELLGKLPDAGAEADLAKLGSPALAILIGMEANQRIQWGTKEKLEAVRRAIAAIQQQEGRLKKAVAKLGGESGYAFKITRKWADEGPVVWSGEGRTETKVGTYLKVSAHGIVAEAAWKDGKIAVKERTWMPAEEVPGKSSPWWVFAQECKVFKSPVAEMEMFLVASSTPRDEADGGITVDISEEATHKMIWGRHQPKTVFKVTGRATFRIVDGMPKSYECTIQGVHKDPVQSFVRKYAVEILDVGNATAGIPEAAAKILE